MHPKKFISKNVVKLYYIIISTPNVVYSKLSLANYQYHLTLKLHIFDIFEVLHFSFAKF